MDPQSESKPHTACLRVRIAWDYIIIYIYHVRYPGIFVCTVSKTYRTNPKIVVAEYGISHFMEFLNYDDPQYNGQYNTPRIINQLALKLRGHEFSL